MGVILESCWCHFGSLWGHFGVMLGSLLGNFGVIFPTKWQVPFAIFFLDPILVPLGHWVRANFVPRVNSQVYSYTEYPGMTDMGANHSTREPSVVKEKSKVTGTAFARELNIDVVNSVQSRIDFLISFFLLEKLH